MSGGRAYAVGWRASQVVPAGVLAAAARVGADIAWRRDGEGVRRLAGNLARVAPDLDAAGLRALTRRGMRSYARYWQEAFGLPSRRRADVVATFLLDGEQRLRDLHAQGRGVVLALPHSANWDHAGAWACLTGLPVAAVAERLRPEEVYRRFLAYRESLGMEILPLGGSRSTLGLLSERLAAGRVVTLLADRDLSGRGVEVDLCGAPARLPGGPAALALRTGAPLVVLSLWFGPGVTHGRLVGPLEPPSAGGRFGDRVTALTRVVAEHLGDGIVRHPADWHMLQPLWTADLPAGRAPG